MSILLSIPLITGITDYINQNPTTFVLQLGGTVLALVLSVRFARTLQRITMESLRGGRASDGWGNLLGRLAYLSMTGLGLLVIVAIWGVYSYQAPLVQRLRDQGPIWLRIIPLIAAAEFCWRWLCPLKAR